MASYLPANNNNIISVIGGASVSFTDDTMAQRLTDLGTHSDMRTKQPPSISLIDVLGDCLQIMHMTQIKQSIQYLNS